MPISPKDIRPVIVQREAQLQRRIVTLESEIDTILKQKAPKPGENVQYGLPMNEPQAVIDAIIADYQAAGWEVTRWQGVSQDASNDICFKYK